MILDHMLFEIHAGEFAIFGPEDIHAPGLIAETSLAVAEVRKVVVKCLIKVQ
jgi:beta-galactosidase beta subunit